MLRNQIRYKLRAIGKVWQAGINPRNLGYCLVCERKTVFIEKGVWLRDQYVCFHCNSIPRNRALINAIRLFAPGYHELIIHESSPGNESSKHLKRHCRNYSDSQYYPNIRPGIFHQGFRCENLECLTFPNEKFDLFVTSDVFEHIMDPQKSFSEIARVLKPGGLHIFTMPWYPDLDVSRRRAVLDKLGRVKHLEDPIYHGNPASDEGSLVTMDWGKDFCDKIYEYSGMTTTIYLEKNRGLGLDGKFLEVFISRKPYA